MQTATGWRAIWPIFEMLASRFSNCESFEYEVIAAGVSATSPTSPESSTTAAVGHDAPEAYALRVTTVFRREDGQWRVIPRHADPVPGRDSTRAQLGRLRDAPGSG